MADSLPTGTAAVQPRNHQPIRVCLVSAAYHPYPSGVSEHVHNLAESLHRLGLHVHVLTTNYHGARFLPSSPCSGFPVTRLGQARLVPMNRSFATVPVGLRLAAQVKRFFAEHRFDVVHCHGMFWPEISYWAIRYSDAVHVVTFLTAGFKLRTWGSRLFRRLFRQHLARIHGLVPISNRAWQAFQSYVPGKPRIIPSGVDLARFRPGLPPLPEKDPTRPTILFLGRLDARKGLTVLLRSMPMVIKSVPGARLVVVGTGPRLAEAKRICHQLGLGQSVIFQGAVTRDDLPRYYCGCDVYCSPALGGETLGIVLLEAMASGVPVVASDIPGYDETIENSKTGLLVPPDDPAALATALTRVLTDPGLRSRLATAGLARVRQYAWPIVARKTVEYYLELLNRHSGPAASGPDSDYGMSG